MRRFLTILLLLAVLPAVAQQRADSLFVSFPAVVEGMDVEPETVPLIRTPLKQPVSFGIIGAIGATRFTGEATETFGGGPSVVIDGQVAYRRVRAGLGLGVGTGRLLEDYYFQGPWPKGEYYSHSQFYGTLGWDVLSTGKFRLTPYAGYGVRVLSYTYYHGYDEDDPSLSWDRNGPCLFLGLETSLRILGSDDAGMGLFGRIYASRAGFPGLAAHCWALHFAVGIDLAASIH